MSYQSGIPTGTVPLNQDYLNIQSNFTQLNTQFLVDHVPLTSTSGTPPNGYHTVVHLVPNTTVATNPPDNYPVTAPATTAGFGQLFAPQVNDSITTDESLYFQSGNGLVTQLTRNFAPSASANGFTFLPGGLILQWGEVNAPGNVGTVTFSTANMAFPANCFSVMLTPRNDGSHSAFTYFLDGAFTKTAFSYRGSTSGSNSLFWIALGN